MEASVVPGECFQTCRGFLKLSSLNQTPLVEASSASISHAKSEGKDQPGESTFAKHKITTSKVPVTNKLLSAE
jgi:hypothetical protein